VLEVPADVLPTPASPGPPEAARPATLDELERARIAEALGQAGWVIDGPRGAAAALGLHPNTLRSRLKKLGISRPGHGAS
jgi:transcriptional regulator with GAF, ATPase, and Fis domain